MTDSTKLKTEDYLISLLTPFVAPLGYEIVHLETILSRQKVLRLFIDFADQNPSKDSQKSVGIEDCIQVNRALEEPLEQISEIEAVFSGPYDLEVSSPGIDRPLRTPKDYEKFSGKEIRVHTFRPRTSEEIENSEYQEKNPKQKNFLGELLGFQNQKILLNVAYGKTLTNVRIPIQLVSKSHLEPDLESIQNKRSKT